MASNLDYLDPALIPLEEKVNAYLEAEKALQRATAALKSEPLHDKEVAAAAAQFEQRPPTGSFNQEADERNQKIENLRTDLALLEREIIALIPTRDEWVKVNLGYGPSRVGAWHVPALGGKPERYELRIVH
ncbi:hypothetical protein Q3A66_02870 [Hymenobacter sp. BT770]|uniref:hypothetical protein n=1 Tax=Hymenobacter sp. BT770 TaxID=2886942 RepID=UPI001D12BFC7|nr:hypothetical protein [Hymenobacter sp. BT770]MCC3152181.1 hypothetical protein [Hymenobacter sp. BT770]MDO3413995.1 hypothetical protein [Hymenobacter sp. BT770]